MLQCGAVIKVTLLWISCFFFIELGIQANVQQVAQYKEASLVQRGPAWDAFVATVSQQLADRLQDCCQFIKGGQTKFNGHQGTNCLFNQSFSREDN
jgi:hypothetical protein